MKRVIGLIILASCLIVIFTACRTSETKEMVKMSRFNDINYVSMKSDFEGYKSWTMVTKKPVTGDPFEALGQSHAGETGFRIIYINDVGKDVSMGMKDFPYPVGTILAKDNFPGVDGKMGELAVITFMVKRGDDYDPENGNWEYVRFSPQFEVQAQGKVGGCIGCHSGAESTDYVFYNMR